MKDANAWRVGGSDYMAAGIRPFAGLMPPKLLTDADVESLPEPERSEMLAYSAAECRAYENRRERLRALEAAGVEDVIAAQNALVGRYL